MTCKQFDTIFREAEQEVSDQIIKKKMVVRNNYWGKVPDGGPFPRNAGTTIKKIRLSRIGFGEMENGWSEIIDSGCDVNLCADVERDSMQRGWEESYYSIERFGWQSEEICLAALTFRADPEEELGHYMEALTKRAAYEWEKYAQSRYIHLAENKFVFRVPDSMLDTSGNCDFVKKMCMPDITTDGFTFWHRGANGSTATGDGPIDERYLSVQVPPDKITSISELTLDMFDIASEQLEAEDENFRLLDEGVELFDCVLAHKRMGSRLAQIERIDESACISTMYDNKELTKKLGTKKVFRDRYSIRYDSDAPRFFPDYAYNQTLETYNPNDPDTWPRFRRVFKYKQVRNTSGRGVKAVPNPEYAYAPFGISTIFTPLVFRIRAFPETKSIGSAMLGEGARNYAGRLTWVNEYDKKCNPNREKGFWKGDIGAAAEPDRPENGYCFFHRIDHTMSLVVNECGINPMTCTNLQTNDCYGTALSGESLSAGERGANTIDHVNSNRFSI